MNKTVDHKSHEMSKHVKHASRIFREHGDFILAVIHSHMKGKAEADDIFQDFFLSLVIRPIPEDIVNIKAYLYRSITNDVIDAARRVKNYKTHISRHAKRSKNTIAKVYRPDAIVVNAERTQNIFKIIETKLCKPEIKALKLKYKNGYSSKEAAEQMGIKRQSVNRYITSAIKKLRCFFAKSVMNHLNNKQE